MKAGVIVKQQSDLNYHKPLTKTAHPIEQLSLEDITMQQKAFDSEQHFIDDSLRLISSQKILKFQELDELVGIRE